MSYGNEITNAVAEYSLDPAGSLYELHAPQIEIPTWAPPNPERTSRQSRI